MSGPEPLDVLQIHNRYRERGGEDVLVEAEQSLLQANGHRVARFERTNPQGTVAASAGLLLSPWNPVSALQLRRFVHARRPGVAHVHNTWFSVSPSVLAVLHQQSIPTVMTVHNYRLACINGQLLREGRPCETCVGTHPWHGARYRCYRGSLPASVMAASTLSLNRRLGTWDEKVAVFLVLTEFMSEILRRSGIPSERIMVAPNFVADPGQRVTAPGDSDTVLFVGRLASEKGIEHLLDGWERAGPPGLRLVVVGDGPLRKSLEERAIRGVSFRGAVPRAEVVNLMLTSRILAFPSLWYEGQPMVLLEALASGLPIFAPALGGISETVGDGGIAVESWPDAFLNEAVDDAALNRLSPAGRARWRDLFTPAAHFDALVNAYRLASYSQNSIA